MIARKKIHDWIDERANLKYTANPYGCEHDGSLLAWEEGVDWALHSLLDLLERDVDDRIQGALEAMGK